MYRHVVVKKLTGHDIKDSRGERLESISPAAKNKGGKQQQRNAR
jgi:hypothetical protein